MNKIFLIIILITFSANIFSQNNLEHTTNNHKEDVSTKRLEIKGVSPTTALFILDSEASNTRNSLRSTPEIKEKYGLISLEESDYINAFVITSSSKDLKEKYGFLENDGGKNEIKTGLIPINKLFEMSLDNNVSYIDIGSEAQTQLDSALLSTNVVSVHNALGGLPEGLSGSGVIVGIIDTGFDYTHPTFFKSDTDEYRVLRTWEQRNNSGTKPSGHYYGSEYIGSGILAKKYDLVDKSHGMHVAGIAAGSGKGTEGKYKGVAYESDIILVSTTMRTPDISDGISYIFKHAEALGKPCVINISIGGHTGPHDGSSFFDKFCEGYNGKGQIIVGAAGNEGKNNIYINKKFTQNDTIVATAVQFTKEHQVKGKSLFDIWGEENQSFKVRVSIYNINTNEIESSTPYYLSTYSASNTFTLGDVNNGTCTVRMFPTPKNFNNSKPSILIEIDNTQQKTNLRIPIIRIYGQNTEIKMWANSALLLSRGLGSEYVNGTSKSTVGEIGGTGKNIISVGAYTSKFKYINEKGAFAYSPNITLNGEIAPFSSLGPTADNRTKPDITAPGNVVVSSVSSYDTNFNNNTGSSVHAQTDGIRTWRNAAMAGTSMASPMVAGIIALWLEKYPQMDTKQALKALKSSAIIDSYTGSIPETGSNTWGWGKIDALAGLLALANDPSINISEYSNYNKNVIIFPNPAKSILNIKSNQIIIGIELTNLEGKSIIGLKNINTNNYVLNIEDINNGIYFIRIKLEDSVVTKKFIINK